MEVHHIGYLVKNIDKSIKSFEALGYDLTTPPTWDDGRKAHLCFLTSGGGTTCVELIAPTPESELYPLLKQYKNTPYHMCYKCDDLDHKIEELKRHKFLLFLKPSPAPVIGETAQVAFLINSNIGIIELLEEQL